MTMPNTDITKRRQSWMATLARSDRQAIEERLSEAVPLPGHTRLRGPEAGLVMVRGRAGGSGAPFNLGEMTVTRCSVRNEQGRIGHAYIAGRDGRKAELAAALDAALQDPDFGTLLEERVITPLASALAEADTKVAAEADATRVDFFTLATMRS
ncbi:MAG TPA: phosphonate C-P lyase system protein PhnG [Acidisoma sp.]|uniref:phosphonate C-P lyase system protein PhnG n=1 Tax=Acidisoma sp. TaxID=1872115 RepID=UPI002B74B811|nr:phosphonate C-P lyase system protein PhnG [Acidisoma sp.]HTI02557.1 phosphonate C-P lyase system protein PhnG [Acidisoma sp.]